MEVAMARKFDPFSGTYIESTPEFPIWETKQNSNPPLDRGTINHAARAEKIILDQPGRRSGEPGSGAEVEKAKDLPPIIRG
jgi:hypothetical protein